MSHQSVRITNYGANTENLNLTNALHAVGINVDNAMSGDIVYIVFDKDGKKMCSARGVLKEPIEIDSFGWPEDHDFVSIWQIDGQLQFCELFDLRALKSSRDASQYLWYIDRAEVIENDRIKRLLNQLFFDHATNDGNLIMHEKLQQHSDQVSKQITASTVLQSSPIVRWLNQHWEKFVNYLTGNDEFEERAQRQSAPTPHEEEVQDDEPPVDERLTDNPALQVAAAEERICESGFGVVVSEDDEDHFNIQEFASELNAELSAEMNPSVKEQLNNPKTDDIQPEDLTLDLPASQPVPESAPTPADAESRSAEDISALENTTVPKPAPEVLSALEEVALDLGIAVELAELTTGATVAVVEPSNDRAKNIASATTSAPPREGVVADTGAASPGGADDDGFAAFDAIPEAGADDSDEDSSIISVDDFLK